MTAPPTALDWIFLAVLAASLLIGAWRGLAFEVLSLAGWIAAFVAAQHFAEELGALLPMREAPPLWRYVAGFALIFIAAVFACGMLAWGLKKLVYSVGLRPADRALGGIFGVLRGVVLLLVTAVVIGATPLAQAPWWLQSHSAPLLHTTLQTLAPLLPALPDVASFPAIQLPPSR